MAVLLLMSQKNMLADLKQNELFFFGIFASLFIQAFELTTSLLCFYLFISVVSCITLKTVISSLQLALMQMPS